MSDSYARTQPGLDDAADTGPIATRPAGKPERGHRPYLPHSIRIFAVPIILIWLFVTVLVNVIVPTLEKVGEAHSAPMTPLDAPSMKAMMRMGHNFHEFDSNSTVMIVLEGQQPLGPDAHQYYDKLIRQLRQDPKHIQHIQDFMTFGALACSRGVVAVLAYHNAFGLTTFAANILTMLAIAAGTDYGIFLVGRYQEALRAGEDRETAYYTTFKGVAPVVLGSGLTIAGATYCLSFARLPWFNTMGAPVANGMLVVVAAGLTLGPAVIFVGSRFHLFQTKRAARQGRLWRRVGTAVVRWPAAILAVSAAVVLVGMIALPSYVTSYNDRHYLPASAPSNQGQEAANRHFSEARMNPDLLMVEADHDMRNPADMLVLDR